MRPRLFALALSLAVAASPAVQAEGGRGADESATIGYQAASEFFALFLVNGSPFLARPWDDFFHVWENELAPEGRREALDAAAASEALRKTIAAQAKAREHEKAGEDLIELIDELVRPDDYLPGLDD